MKRVVLGGLLAVGLGSIAAAGACGSSSSDEDTTPGATAGTSGAGAGGSTAGAGGSSAGAGGATAGAGGTTAGAGGSTAGAGGTAAGAGGTAAGAGGASAGAAGAAGGVPGTPSMVFDNVRITSNSAGPNFQQANATIDFGAGPFTKVTLVVDLASTCFPFDGWKTNPPPTGQNWPADCDAFDRNFEFTLDEPKDATGTPAIELVRAITPFGGPLHLEVDVTDIANGLPGKHDIRVTIPTWSDGAGKVSGSNGGWNVTAKLFTVDGPAPHKVLAVKPLVNFTHGDMTMTKEYPFEVPAGTKSARIEYRVTGHGGPTSNSPGCIGPAEEFCKRTHTLILDTKEIVDFSPWRSDCDKLCTIVNATSGPIKQYCGENPCGAIQSVKAPRANWCPGSMTPPYVFENAVLTTPGAHTWSYAISKVATGGVWRMSATYIALGD